MKVKVMQDIEITPFGSGAYYEREYEETRQYKTGHLFKTDPSRCGGDTILTDTKTGEDIRVSNSRYWHLVKIGALQEVKKRGNEDYDWNRDPLGLERNRW